VPRRLVEHYSGFVCAGVLDEIKVGSTGNSIAGPCQCVWASSNLQKAKREQKG
jgi:hypothetical protein